MIQKRVWDYVKNGVFHWLVKLLTLATAGLLIACDSIPQSQRVNIPTTTMVPDVFQMETPTPSQTPVLEEFPLYKGTNWTYTRINYEPLATDPSKVVKGTNQIKETVTGIWSSSDYYIAQIHRDETFMDADPGYSQNNITPSEDYWYIVEDNQVFIDSEQPDLANLQTESLILEYQFPLYENSSWCPNRIGKATLGVTPPATSVPCAFTGKRFVESEGSYQAKTQTYDHCYKITDIINSGGITQWFCDGVGIVFQQYDHGGSKFGFSQSLMHFAKGTP